MNKDVQQKQAGTATAPNEREARRAKVAALKQAVQSGNYKLHTEDIVYSVLKEFAEQFG